MLHADVLMITSRCSAGCRPCPFGNGSVESRYLSDDAILNRMASSSAPLIVLTGGEPFEHPQFDRLLQELIKVDAPRRPFRIATGGHHRLDSALETLANADFFEGFSLGTDVLGPLCDNNQTFIPLWRENIRGLNATQTPYSITLTLHGEMEQSGEILSSAARCGARPDFLYLRVLSGDRNLLEIKRLVRKIWPGLKVIEDKL